MELEKKRWFILLASCVVNVCIGTGYAWSVFQVALVNDSAAIFGAAVAASVVAKAFTIDISMAPIPMIAGGGLQKRFGPKVVIMIGGFLFSLGFFLSGQITSVYMLYLTFGVLGGFGTAFAYSITIANSVRLFPDKKGMVAGISTASFGLGSIVMPPIIQWLISCGGVLYAFRTLGIVFFFVIMAAAQFVSECSPDWRPRGWTPPAASASARARDKDWREMLADRRFWLMFAAFTLFAAAGLMLVSQGGSMAITIGGAAGAALSVSLIGAANTAGRIVWGAISDRIGRYPALLSMCALLTASALLLSFVGGSYAAFILPAMLLSSCYGGSMGVFPALTADSFGVKNNGVNYGIIFIGFAFGGYIGPILATALKASTGSYSTPMRIVAVMGCAAFALTALLSAMKRRSVRA